MAVARYSAAAADSLPRYRRQRALARRASYSCPPVAIGSIKDVVQVLNAKFPLSILFHCRIFINAADPRSGRTVGIAAALEQAQAERDRYREALEKIESAEVFKGSDWAISIARRALAQDTAQ